MIEHGGPVPVYQQIADLIEARIRDGTVPAGRPIPSEKTIVQEYGVARTTARRVVDELRSRGLVFTVAHRGTFVLPADRWPNQPGGSGGRSPG
jgi:DNA-binding GntR family transcriptional regulator